MSLTRREAMQSAAVGALALTFAGANGLLTPAQARAAGVPFVTLSGNEVATLDALGDVLLPGARTDGISHFIDQQIGVPANEALLLLRYLDFPPPYASFYQGGLAALGAASQASYGAQFQDLDAADKNSLVVQMATGTPTGWTGIPAPLFYFVVRSDAIDVVYGTVAGFERLGFPYMPHILPPRNW